MIRIDTNKKRPTAWLTSEIIDSEHYNLGYKSYPYIDCPFKPINERGYYVWDDGKNHYNAYMSWWRGFNKAKAYNEPKNNLYHNRCISCESEKSGQKITIDTGKLYPICSKHARIFNDNRT